MIEIGSVTNLLGLVTDQKSKQRFLFVSGNKTYKESYQ